MMGEGCSPVLACARSLLRWEIRTSCVKTWIRTSTTKMKAWCDVVNRFSFCSLTIISTKDIVDEDRESKGRQKEDEKARESAPGIELHDEIEETNSSAGEKLLDMSMNTEISVERMSDKTDDTFSHIGLAPAREVGHPQNSAHRRQEEEEEEEEERTVADCEGNVFRVVQPQPTSTQTSTTTATNREASTRTRRRRIWSWKHLQLLINLAFGIAVPVLIRTARTQWITAPINGTPSSVPVLIGVTVALEFCLMPTMLAIIYSKFLSRLPESRNEDYIPSRKRSGGGGGWEVERELAGEEERSESES
eukprot:765317-Hanusia_phi.AAC.2